MNPVHQLISKVRFRLAVHRWSLFMVRGLIAGVILGGLWILATRLFPQSGNAESGTLILLAASILSACIWSFLKMPSRTQSSLELDKRLNLNERVTSSLEMEDMSGPMVDALREDVVKKVDSISYNREFPLLSTRGLNWLSALLIVTGLLYMFLPEFDLTGHNERIAEAKATDAVKAVAVERIEKIQKNLTDLDEADVPALKEFDLALNDLKNDLEKGKISEKQMVARLSNLSDDLRRKRNAFQKNNPVPKVAGDLKQFSMAKELAAAIQKGKMGKAAEMAKAMQQKLQKGDLSEQEKKALQKDLKSLSEMLGGENTELGKALAKAQAGLESGDMKAALEAMKGAEMSLEDLESIMKQMDQMDQTMFKLAEWKQGSFGESEFCRECGSKLSKCEGEGGECESEGGHTHNGVCGSCSGGGNKAGSGNGLGLGGAGRGQGNRLGKLPDVPFNTTATKTSGALTKGRMLADIMQKASPELGQEASVEMISGAFIQLQQATEQALTQEEIPDASKELVRQYFGALEPEKTAN